MVTNHRHQAYNNIHVFSITLSATTQNCPAAWPTQARACASAANPPWFAFTLELGSRREHLHVQGVMKCRCPGTTAGTKLRANMFKGFLKHTRRWLLLQSQAMSGWADRKLHAWLCSEGLWALTLSGTTPLHFAVAIQCATALLLEHLLIVSEQ